MAKQVEVEGIIYDVPDNATMGDIKKYLASKGVTAPKKTTASVKPKKEDLRSASEVAMDQMRIAGEGIPQAITGLPASVAALGSAAFSGLTGDVRKSEAQLMELLKGVTQPFTTSARGAAALIDPSIEAPSREEFEQAARGAGAFTGAILTGEGAAAGFKAIPRTSRAGANFKTVMGAAKDVPLNLTEADQILTRAQELRQRGSTMPKVMRDFERVRQPGNFMGQPVDIPMTYEAGRDFATSAGALSSREATALNAPMQRQVGQFAQALKNANRDAAAKVGMGDLYDQAMKEYRQAKTLEEAKAVAKKYAIRVALGGTGIYLIEREIEKLFGR